ncbi:unnamed protein product [Lampetra fluviatilis]
MAALAPASRNSWRGEEFAAAIDRERLEDRVGETEREQNKRFPGPGASGPPSIARSPPHGSRTVSAPRAAPASPAASALLTHIRYVFPSFPSFPSSRPSPTTLTPASPLAPRHPPRCASAAQTEGAASSAPGSRGADEAAAAPSRTGEHAKQRD